ncbi:hypothetical protein [Bacillus marasmi]|uniref:hypothetical protein n=1 Tax=Bacillus marasmi TaxID=1926279 RepID=UPI0011CCB837|nr:hypothetical protein [Bacillus marasmi]
MNEPLIYKPELLTRLNEIYCQLEKLEDVIHSSFIEHQEYVHHLQEDRVDHCLSRMTTLENTIDQQVVDNTQHKPIITHQCKSSASISLNLV